VKPNKYRQAIAEGRVPVGHMIMEFGTRGIAKILETASLDFVFFDMEHTGFDTERIADLIAFTKATPIAPFVRVPQGLYHFLARCMDAGALGVMVANVRSAEEARRIVQSVKFAPLGYRGLGLGTAHNDFIQPDPVAYFKQANESSVVICQIESVEGVENAEAIAATEGVDILWVGHFDLSQSMGIPAQLQHPRFLDGLKRTVEGARKHGKRLGIQPGSMEQARQWREIGFDVFSYNSDIGVYRSALQSSINDLRTLLQHG